MLREIELCVRPGYHSWFTIICLCMCSHFYGPFDKTNKHPPKKFVGIIFLLQQSMIVLKTKRVKFSSFTTNLSTLRIFLNNFRTLTWAKVFVQNDSLPPVRECVDWRKRRWSSITVYWIISLSGVLQQCVYIVVVVALETTSITRSIRKKTNAELD